MLTIRPPSCESWLDFSLISCDQHGEPPSLYQISSFMHNITSIFYFIPYVNINLSRQNMNLGSLRSMKSQLIVTRPSRPSRLSSVGSTKSCASLKSADTQCSARWSLHEQVFSSGFTNIAFNKVKMVGCMGGCLAIFFSRLLRSFSQGTGQQSRGNLAVTR